MQIIHSISPIKDLIQPVVLTIGNFDGVHLGHQVILKRVTQLASLHNIPSAIFTFVNHPSSILRPNHPIPMLTSFPQKVKFFEEFGFDYVIAIEFTKKFSEQSAEEFLKTLHEAMSFRYLILGYDAKIGNDRQGDGTLLHDLAFQLHFLLEFLPAEMMGGMPISSSRIRKAIQEEDLDEANKCLGRKYSIYGKVVHGEGKGKELGYPTANILLDSLCFPPYGVYVVSVKTSKGIFPAVSNLGIAPTVRHDHIPILETHFLQGERNLYGEPIEVIFEEFLRPEWVFASLDALKNQIAQDVKQAKEFFHL